MGLPVFCRGEVFKEAKPVSHAPGRSQGSAIGSVVDLVVDQDELGLAAGEVYAVSEVVFSAESDAYPRYIIERVLEAGCVLLSVHVGPVVVGERAGDGEDVVIVGAELIAALAAPPAIFGIAERAIVLAFEEEMEVCGIGVSGVDGAVVLRLGGIDLEGDGDGRGSLGGLEGGLKIVDRAGLVRQLKGPRSLGRSGRAGFQIRAIKELPILRFERDGIHGLWRGVHVIGRGASTKTNGEEEEQGGFHDMDFLWPRMSGVRLTSCVGEKAGAGRGSQQSPVVSGLDSGIGKLVRFRNFAAREGNRRGFGRA